MNLNINWLPPDNKSGLEAWDPFSLLPQLISIFLVSFIIMLLCLAYNRGLKKTVVDEAPRGIVLFAEIAIKWAERQVVSLLGVKYKKLTIYFMYLLLFIGIGNLMSIIGFDSPVTAYTIPGSLGLIAFFGIYYFGLKYQRLAFFKKYITNPLEIIQQFVPLISISFRLFGNILGGTVILTLLVTLLNNIWGNIPIIGPVDLLSGTIVPFLSLYFDIFDGLIQAYIFSILTIAYWSAEMAHGTNKHKKSDNIRQSVEIIDRSYDINQSRTNMLLANIKN